MHFLPAAFFKKSLVQFCHKKKSIFIMSNCFSVKEESKKEMFNALIIAHAKSLHRFALNLCHNHFDAEDLVGETVLKAYKNLHYLKDQNKIRQWLFKILNNLFLSNFRKEQKHRQLHLQIENNKEADASFSLYEQISRSDFVIAGNPEKNFISKITMEQIQGAIDSLPEEFRTSLVLCDIEDFSYKEIAEITAVPIGTVRSRIARARINLQRKLWIYAQDIGIRKTKTNRVKNEHICTCGEKEEITQTTIISD
jgi:RNA polymerase sigma factor (sigma-70 family)